MIVAILQARMSSSRLPGKVMRPLAGAPMLARQIERIGRARRIDRLIVATSIDPGDDCIEDLTSGLGVGCFRGSLLDVLDRSYQAAASLTPDHVVRLTADCPLADWEIIDGCIAFGLDGGYDYASNTIQPTWPDGLDVEFMTFAALQATWREADTAYQREHVTPFLYQQPERFRLGLYQAANDLSAMRWTVDEPADYELVSAIYEALYPDNPAFRTPDILDLLRQRPELAKINRGFQRGGTQSSSRSQA